jgi:putative transposase
MKDSYPKPGVERFCRLFGMTRQAYYQHGRHAQIESIEEELIIKEVLKIREKHRLMGGRKLYGLLCPFMEEHGIKMGRDKFFDILAANRLLVRCKRRRISTTQSWHDYHKYPNLIKDFTPQSPNEVWVSDITYFYTKFGFLYISLVTDAYSHKVVGYQIADTLKGIGTLQALRMALNNIEGPVNQLIHHSDRGTQYCWKEYVGALHEKSISVSMTQTGNPRENAIAERINGIIKHEYMDFYPIKNLQQAKQALENAVNLYNTERPHLSLGMLVPENVHRDNLQVEKLWSNKSYSRPPADSPMKDGATGGQNNFYQTDATSIQNTNIVNSFQDYK